MAPAQQRLEADQPARGEIDQRLKEHLERVTLDGRDEVLHALVTLIRVDAHHHVETPDAPPGLRLGDIKREVGVALQGGGVRPVLRPAGDAEARRHAERPAGHRVDDELAEPQVELGRAPQQPIAINETGQEERELVAPDPRADIARPQARPQARADLAQHRIAGGMAVRVVDLLEIVEVDRHQRSRRAGHADGLVEQFAETAAVDETRHRVVRSEIFRTRRGLNPVGDVAFVHQNGQPPAHRIGRRADVDAVPAHATAGNHAVIT